MVLNFNSATSWMKQMVGYTHLSLGARQRVMDVIHKEEREDHD